MNFPSFMQCSFVLLVTTVVYVCAAHYSEIFTRNFAPGTRKSIDKRHVKGKQMRVKPHESNTLKDCSIKTINSNPLQQDDPCTVSIIRQTFLHPPSLRGLHLSHPEVKNPSMGQTQKVTAILKNQRGGFFIECGALDGETRSNTLYLEKELGWEGVLIEGDPDNLKKVLQKQRKAWAVSACLSKTSRPQIVSFQQRFNRGRISSAAGKKRPGFADVQCFPIYSILVALNRTTVDYFSLDVEGDELSVLKTIPWHLVDIRTLSVEYIHDREGKHEIGKFMTRQGYEVAAEVTHAKNLANDLILVKKSLVSI